MTYPTLLARDVNSPPGNVTLHVNKARCYLSSSGQIKRVTLPCKPHDGRGAGQVAADHGAIPIGPSIYTP